MTAAGTGQIITIIHGKSVSLDWYLHVFEYRDGLATCKVHFRAEIEDTSH
jgi:hypothetical protein